jgi:hypothetical protein
MAKKTFSATVEKWVKENKAFALAVFRDSAQAVIEEMQTSVGHGGNMPVKTGFLRSSLNVNINGVMATASVPHPGGEGPYPEPDINLAISGAKLVANYALRINYGFSGQDSLGRTYNQSGRMFVEKAAAKWPEIVARVSAQLRT